MRCNLLLAVNISITPDQIHSGLAAGCKTSTYEGPCFLFFLVFFFKAGKKNIWTFREKNFGWKLAPPDSLLWPKVIYGVQAGGNESLLG